MYEVDNLFDLKRAMMKREEALRGKRYVLIIICVCVMK